MRPPVVSQLAQATVARGFGRYDGASFDFDEDDIDAEISAVLLLRCSADERPGLALWGGPRNDVASDIEDPAVDQAELVDLIEQFGFCSG